MTCKCEQVVLSRTSVCLAISNFILLFSYSFHVPSTILFNVYLYIVRSMFLFLFNRWQSMPRVVNQISQLFFWSSKIFFALLNFLKMVIFITLFRRWPTLWNATLKITKLFRHCLTLLENVDSTLFNVVNFNVDINNVVSTLIWRCPTSRRHITLTTTFSQLWNICWVLKNVAKRLHNFVKFIKLKTYIFNRVPLNCCFRKF